MGIQEPLLSGENPTKLHRILGHKTLEMTRKYIDMVAVAQSRVQHMKFLPIMKKNQYYPVLSLYESA